MNPDLLASILTQLEALFKAALLSIPQRTDLKKSNLIKSVEATATINTIELWAFEYALSIEYGTKPHAVRVPVTDLMDWIKRYNINKGRKISDNKLASIIQNAIFAHGIKPRPFLQKFTDQAVEMISLELVNDFEITLTKTFDNLYKK